MRRAAMLAVLPGLLCLAACRDEKDESPAPTVARTPSELGGELIEIRTKMQIAAEERTEPIATGEVVEGSRVGTRRSASVGRSAIPTGAMTPR